MKSPAHQKIHNILMICLPHDPQRGVVRQVGFYGLMSPDNGGMAHIQAHPINQGDYAYSFVSLKRKNFISVTPLKAALNALILALNDSAKALVSLLTKKFKTSS